MTKIRNPFPAIGKVMKYEFLHSSKKVLPLYGVLLVLGLICGFTANPDKMTINSSQIEFGYSSTDAVSTAGAISSTVYFALIIASIVVTIVVLDGRFKKSMLGEEAYLNLSLPVTIGEHIWGRIFATVIFDLICAVFIALSFLLCFSIIIHQSGGMQYVSDAFTSLIADLNRQNFHFNKFTFILTMIILFLSANMVIVSFVFLIDSFAQLFKKNKGLLQFICAIVLIFITAKLCSFLPDTESFGVAILIMLAISGIYFTGIYFIFTKSLNLE